MRALFFLMFIAMIAFFIGVVVLVINTFYFISSPSGTKGFKRAVDKARESMAKLGILLIPHEDDTLELLSAELNLHKKPSLFNVVGSAVLPTVYKEPYVQIAYQKAGANGLILAQTGAKSEYIFKKTAKQTEIWVNEKPFGIYSDGNLISPEQRGRLIAQVQLKEQAEWLSVLIGDKKVAAIANPSLLKGVNPRAITKLSTLDATEEEILFVLVLLITTEPLFV